MLQKSSNYLREVKVAIQMEDIYKDRVFNWDQAAMKIVPEGGTWTIYNN